MGGCGATGEATDIREIALCAVTALPSCQRFSASCFYGWQVAPDFWKMCSTILWYIILYPIQSVRDKKNDNKHH